MLKQIPFIITRGFASNEMAGAPELHKGNQKNVLIFKKECESNCKISLQGGGGIEPFYLRIEIYTKGPIPHLVSSGCSILLQIEH